MKPMAISWAFNGYPSPIINCFDLRQTSKAKVQHLGTPTPKTLKKKNPKYIN